ncbi:MAG: hypothetical protein V5A55_08830 [Halovenus sp.]
MSRSGPSRRRLLTSLSSAVAVATLAGCAESGDTDSGNADDGPSTGDDADSDGADGGDADGEDLDPREANVVGVAVEEQNGTYTFDVTLHHDDDGEEGYANWWQVERPDGTRLGRRDLLHAHSQQPFTRSEAIDVPAEVSCVVVRGHDQTHGYGGLAVVMDLASGETRTVNQGTAKQSFDTDNCP